MSLFTDEDVLIKEIETWRGFIDKLPSDEDKDVCTRLLDNSYNYTVAINNRAQDHPFPTESVILAFCCYNTKSSII